MGIFGRALAAISPAWAASRAKSRMQLQAYEAANPSRTYNTKREPRDANTAVFAAGVSLREQARWLDENNDLIFYFPKIVPLWFDLFRNLLLRMN